MVKTSKFIQISHGSANADPDPGGENFRIKAKMQENVKTSKFIQIFKSKFAQDSLFLTFLTIFNVFYN